MADTRVPLDSDLRHELTELTANMCRALNDPKRLLILYVLGESAMSVGDLCELIDISQSNASQHLAVLRDRGLVNAERRGNNVYYSLRHPRILEAVNLLRTIQAEELDRRQQIVTG